MNSDDIGASKVAHVRCAMAGMLLLVSIMVGLSVLSAQVFPDCDNLALQFVRYGGAVFLVMLGLPLTSERLLAHIAANW